MNSVSSEKKALLRSCESCRASKIRCVPDAESHDRCQRCQRLQRECVFSEARTRARKTASNQGRVAELEKRIDHLSSLLEPPSAEGTSTSSEPRSSTLAPPPGVGTTFTQYPSPLTPQSQQALEVEPPWASHQTTWTMLAPFLSERTHLSDLSPTQSSPTPNLPIPNPRPNGIPDAIENGLISVHDATRLVYSFRRDVTDFPFVVVPNIDIDRFRAERPALLYAILIAASQGNDVLQTRLDDEFRTKLSHRVMVEGMRSLDLVQGLIVYIAWYYHRFTAPDKQLYMFVQMAATMALDLDLETLGPMDQETAETLESKRTLVAVYYFCSGIAMVLRKPITMKYSFKFWDCCRSLAAARQAPNDIYLIHYVHMHGLAEEVSETFGYSEGSHPSLMAMGGIEGLEFRLKAYQHRLYQQRVSIPDSGSVPASLAFTCDSLSVYIHEACLHLPQVSQPPQKSKHHVSPQAVSALSNLLWACLDATKALLNHYLRFTSAQIATQTTIEQGRFAHALVVLIKLSFARIPGLDGFPLQSSCRVSEYLDQIGAAIGNVSDSPDPDPHNPPERLDCFARFRATAVTVRMWYERVASIGAITDADAAAEELPGMSPSKLIDLAREESLFNFYWRDMQLFPVAGAAAKAGEAEETQKHQQEDQHQHQQHQEHQRYQDHQRHQEYQRHQDHQQHQEHRQQQYPRFW